MAFLKGGEVRMASMVVSPLRVHTMTAFRRGMLKFATAQSWGKESTRSIQIVQRSAGG